MEVMLLFFLIGFLLFKYFAKEAESACLALFEILLVEAALHFLGKWGL
jgi:hypothetical protein